MIFCTKYSSDIHSFSRQFLVYIYIYLPTRFFKSAQLLDKTFLNLCKNVWTAFTAFSMFVIAVVYILPFDINPNRA